MRARKTGDSKEMVLLPRNDSYGVWNVDRKEMAGDKEMCALFHVFRRAVAMDEVKYLAESGSADGRRGIGSLGSWRNWGT